MLWIFDIPTVQTLPLAGSYRVCQTEMISNHFNGGDSFASLVSSFVFEFCICICIGIGNGKGIRFCGYSGALEWRWSGCIGFVAAFCQFCFCHSANSPLHPFRAISLPANSPLHCATPLHCIALYHCNWYCTTRRRPVTCNTAMFHHCSCATALYFLNHI